MSTTSRKLIVTVANQKGGVAKTTSAVSIAHGIARIVGHVILADLDQQGQCAIGLGLAPRSAVFDFLVGDAVLANCLTYTDRTNLDLLPGNARTKHVDLVYRNEIDGATALSERMRSLATGGVPVPADLSTIAAVHGALVIDTPTAGLLQEAAIRIADVVVVPARCESLSVDSVHITLSLVAKLNPAARVIILPTMFDRRLAEHAYNLGILRGLGSITVAPPIPARVSVLEASARGLTIWEHEDVALSPVRQAYSSLIDLILEQSTY